MRYKRYSRMLSKRGSSSPDKTSKTTRNSTNSTSKTCSNESELRSIRTWKNSSCSNWMNWSIASPKRTKRLDLMGSVDFTESSRSYWTWMVKIRYSSLVNLSLGRKNKKDAKEKFSQSFSIKTKLSCVKNGSTKLKSIIKLSLTGLRNISTSSFFWETQSCWSTQFETHSQQAFSSKKLTKKLLLRSPEPHMPTLKSRNGSKRPKKNETGFKSRWKCQAKTKRDPESYLIVSICSSHLTSQVDCASTY